MEALWDQLQPEWLLVPAFGKGISAHRRAAERISRMCDTVTVLAHQGDPAQAVGFESFIHAPGERATVHAHGNAPDFACRVFPLGEWRGWI
jgi:hypothetical protein